MEDKMHPLNTGPQGKLIERSALVFSWEDAFPGSTVRCKSNDGCDRLFLLANVEVWKIGFQKLPS